MRKIKIFYVKRTAPLYDGLDSIQQEINQWVMESSNEIVDVKMNISNNNNPVVTVIYTEPCRTENTETTRHDNLQENSRVGDNQNQEGVEWGKGYNLGYHDGNEDRSLGLYPGGAPKPPQGYNEQQEKEWKNGYKQGYIDARCEFPKVVCDENVTCFTCKNDKEKKEE